MIESDKQCEACEKGLHDKCISKIEIPMLRDVCYCEQCNVDITNKTLEEFDKSMIDIMSAQDWGNSFLRVKLQGTEQMQERVNKLSDERKDDIDEIINSALRQIEDIIDFVN